jgi:hypothetical protein
MKERVKRIASVNKIRKMKHVNDTYWEGWSEQLYIYKRKWKNIKKVGVNNYIYTRGDGKLSKILVQKYLK